VAIDPATAARVLERIDESELVELVLRLSNIESPAGEEGPVGAAIHDWLHGAGFDASRIGMFEDRFNVFAELPGHGTGPALAFNSHMDTSVRRDFHLIMRDPSGPTSIAAASRASRWSATRWSTTRVRWRRS